MGHRGVQIIWNTQNRWLYLRLFFLYVVLCYMVAIRTAGPSIWAQISALGPSFAVISEVHSSFQRSSIGIFILSSFSVLYGLVASGAVFCFWKTSLRVPTIAGIDPHRKNDHETLLHKTGLGSRQCGLCPLGLCLDNTSM